MEFLSSNFINTTTQLALPSSTITASNIYNRDLTFQYITENFNDDNTTASIVISFDQTTSINRIAILGMNLKSFQLFYNGATANTFVLTSGDTTASNYSSNSNTSMYFQFASVNVTSVTLDMKSTQVANSEKAFGYLMISSQLLDFDRIPSAADYTPKIDSKEIVHKLSNGGIRIQKIDKKFNAKIKFKYITESFRNSLKEIYDLNTSVLFCPFGTTTSWDGILHDVVWTGDFDFYKYSSDAATSGFTGTITLEETP